MKSSCPAPASPALDLESSCQGVAFLCKPPHTPPSPDEGRSSRRRSGRQPQVTGVKAARRTPRQRVMIIQTIPMLQSPAQLQRRAWIQKVSGKGGPWHRTFQSLSEYLEQGRLWARSLKVSREDLRMFWIFCVTDQRNLDSSNCTLKINLQH